MSFELFRGFSIWDKTEILEKYGSLSKRFNLLISPYLTCLIVYQSYIYIYYNFCLSRDSYIKGGPPIFSTYLRNRSEVGSLSSRPGTPNTFEFFREKDHSPSLCVFLLFKGTVFGLSSVLLTNVFFFQRMLKTSNFTLMHRHFFFVCSSSMQYSSN